jgi:hypothetical protein
MTVSILSYASAARYQPKRRLSSFCLVASRRFSYVVAAMASSTAAALQLKELNQRSAILGTWDVTVCYPRLETWTVPTTGKEGSAFRCLLVSHLDEGAYIAGEIVMRASNKAPLNKAMEKYVHGLSFRISNVKLLSHHKQEYLHTPLKLVVELDKTQANPLLASAAINGIAPKPSMPLSSIKQLVQSQRFDITALIKSMDDPRPVGGGRQVSTIVLIDEADADGKIPQLKMSLFYGVPPSSKMSAMIDILRDAVDNSEAISLFALQGKKQDGGYTVNNSKDFFLAKAIGDKSDRLSDAAAELNEAPAEKCQTFQQEYSGTGKKYEEEQGKEFFCKLLAALSKKTNIAEIEAATTVWQMNWVEVAWPTGEQLCTKDGARLFFRTILRDGTGQVEAWMNEASALQLSNQTNKEGFVLVHSQGKQFFPLAAAVKVIRAIKQEKDLSGGASQPPVYNVHLTIVNAVEQPLTEAPTQSALALLPLLDYSDTDTSSIVAAPLQMVSESQQYAFEVSMQTEPKIATLCQKVLSLVRSTKATTTIQVGQGFKLTTTDVEDVLGDTEKKFTLTAVCTLDNLPQYRLDPPRRGVQYALITVTSMMQDTFIVDQVQLLSEEEGNAATVSLKQLMLLTRQMYAPDRKRGGEWNATFSPASAKKCRFLGRSPTDAIIS